MRADDNPDFVADGQQRIQATREYKLQTLEIRAAIHARYTPDLAAANLFRRLLLRTQMRREINREIEKLAPDHALYAVHLRPKLKKNRTDK